MNKTDCSVYPFPGGSVSVSRFALELQDLGFQSMVAIGHKSCTMHDFTIFGGQYLVPSSARGLAKQLSSGSDSAVTLVQAGDNALNRNILTMKGVHILCGLHSAAKNAFDRYCARLAYEQSVAIDIRIAPLITSRDVSRQKIIRNYEEINKLHQRYEFPITISSGARNITDLRSPRAISYLLESIGFERETISDSLNIIPGLINRGTLSREVFI